MKTDRSVYPRKHVERVPTDISRYKLQFPEPVGNERKPMLLRDAALAIVLTGLLCFGAGIVADSWVQHDDTCMKKGAEAP